MEFIPLHLIVFSFFFSFSLSSPASLRVSPNRSQFFTSDSISLSCEVQGNSTGWKVKMNKPKVGGELVSSSRMSPYIIDSAYKSDSGEYWCESDSLERSNSININVTAGSVILESPVLPVMEGENVTLRCRNRTSPSNIPADFYKDGSLIRTEPTGNITIYHVSKSDEGLYKCHNSDLGESPESKLVLKVFKLQGQPSSTATSPSSSPPLLPLVAGLSVPLSVVVVILIVVLLCFYKKSKGRGEAACVEEVTFDEVRVPKKPRKKKERGEAARVEDVTYSDVNISQRPRKKRERPVGESDPVYSAVRKDTPPDAARAMDDVTYSDIKHTGKKKQRKRGEPVPELAYSTVRTGP